MLGDIGMSDVYMLNNVGENTPPSDTPALIFAGFDVLLYSLKSKLIDYS